MQERCIETLHASHLAEFTTPSLADRDGVSATALVSLPAAADAPAIVYRQAGDNYILIEYGDNVLDLALRLRVHLLMEQLHPACVLCRCVMTVSPLAGV
ncbi:urea carboxylase [Salmonella enterica subsp. enterica serovar Typhi]|nr:urea carboxylase [Salmonella enterica subsp. enterica serovar Typhi]